MAKSPNKPGKPQDPAAVRRLLRPAAARRRLHQAKTRALASAKRLLRQARACALATAMGPEGRPYGSLVLVAMDRNGAPILLISTLAQHTKNLTGDNRMSLLFDGTLGLADPLTGPRLTLLGRATVSRDLDVRARFLARHPSAKRYADFQDFAFWRVKIVRAHFIGGFGQIYWLTAAELAAEKI